LFHLFVILNRYKSYFRFRVEEEKRKQDLEKAQKKTDDKSESDSESDSEINDALERRPLFSKKIERSRDRSRKHEPTSRGLDIIKIEKIRFFSQLLLHFQEEIGISKEQIHFYLAKTSDDFIYFTINYILESIDLEKAVRDFIINISTLTTLIPIDDNFAEIKFIRESNLFSDTNKLLVKMCSRLPRYNEFINILNHDKEESLKSEYDKITRIELISKEDSSNYANCNGIYNLDSDKIVNGKPIFVNMEKGRFIGRSESGWVLTGCQWLEDIIDKSASADKLYSFGGFHSSLNQDVPVAMTKWKDYDVRIINQEMISV